jgi:hypothetical protein
MTMMVVVNTIEASLLDDSRRPGPAGAISRRVCNEGRQQLQAIYDADPDKENLLQVWDSVGYYGLCGAGLDPYTVHAAYTRGQVYELVAHVKATMRPQRQDMERFLARFRDNSEISAYLAAQVQEVHLAPPANVARGVFRQHTACYRVGPKAQIILPLNLIWQVKVRLASAVQRVRY